MGGSSGFRWHLTGCRKTRESSQIRTCHDGKAETIKVRCGTYVLSVWAVLIPCWERLRNYMLLRFTVWELASITVPDCCWNLPSQSKSQDQILVHQFGHPKSINMPMVDKGTDWWTYVTCSAPGATVNLRRIMWIRKWKSLAFGTGKVRTDSK